MSRQINFFSTDVSNDSINFVIETLKSGMISAGKKADLFETKLSEYGFKHPVSLNSGTITMHLALIASGVKEGDEVIIPAQTFISTGLAVLYVGAKPIFADINPNDGNINVESIRNKITKKTKAIIPVHWGGYPCDMDEIIKLSEEFGLSVIEDAAHAFGSIYKNKLIGSISRFTSFSFQAIKHLTTGDGGALCCLNSEDEKLVKRLRWFDIDRENSKTGFLGEREYDAINVGYKYHMNDISASLGIGNLLSISDKLSKLRNFAKIYDENLSNVSGIKLMDYKQDRISSYWLYPIIVDERENFIKKMKESNIPVSVVHQGIDKNSIFGGKKIELIGQRYFDDNQIHIPINSSLFIEDVDYIVKKINEGW
jgi:perosamine synthetase